MAILIIFGKRKKSDKHSRILAEFVQKDPNQKGMVSNPDLGLKKVNKFNVDWIKHIKKNYH